MPKTTALLLTVAVAAAASGCGSSNATKSNTTTGTSTTQTTAAPAKPEEPHGRLTAGEFSAYLDIAKQSERFEKIKSPRKFLTAIRGLCPVFDHAPDTKLVMATRRECRRAVRFYAAAAGFTTQRGECTRAAEAGDISCYGELYSRLARATHTFVASSHEVSSLVKKRGFKGDCADELGLDSVEELATARRLGSAAGKAGRALYARNQPRYEAAQAELVKAFDDLGGGSKENDVKQIRTCKHD